MCGFKGYLLVPVEENIPDDDVQSYDNSQTDKSRFNRAPLVKSTQPIETLPPEHHRSNDHSRGSNKRRPVVAYNERYIQNMNNSPYPKVKPGNQSYADMTKFGKRVVIIGDSHVKRINRINFKQAMVNGTPFFKSFPGAPVEHFDHHITPTLLYNKPDTIVMHIGSNNVTNKTVDNLDARDLAEKIVAIGKRCLEAGIGEVVISSIFTKRSGKLAAKIREVNDYLNDLCESLGIIFVYNNDVKQEHIDRDGVHLTDEGTFYFANSILRVVNHLNGSRF